MLQNLYLSTFIHSGLNSTGNSHETNIGKLLRKPLVSFELCQPVALELFSQTKDLMEILDSTTTHPYF